MFCKLCGTKQALQKTVFRYDPSSGMVSHSIDIYQCPKDNYKYLIVSDHQKQKHYPISISAFFSEEWSGRWYEINSAPAKKESSNK